MRPAHEYGRKKLKSDQSLLHQLAAHVYWPMAVDWIIKPARAIIIKRHAAGKSRVTTPLEKARRYQVQFATPRHD
jgi:hypothetical protein